MPQKPPSPPALPSRPQAPHVQAAVARAVQSKLPERSPAPRQTLSASPTAQPPARLPAEHVHRALAPAQAKLPQVSQQGRPQAPHVVNAVRSAQMKMAAPVQNSRPPASHVAATSKAAGPPPVRHRASAKSVQTRPSPVVQRRKVRVPPLGEIDTEDYTERQLDGFITRYLMAPGTSESLDAVVAAIEAKEFKREEAPPRARRRRRVEDRRREPVPERLESLRRRESRPEPEVRERKESGFRVGSNPEWSYPAQPPTRLKARRSGFSQSETDGLLDPSQLEEASSYADVTRFSLHENKGSGIGTLRLGISYNHILADSRIRYLYSTALKRVRHEGTSAHTRARISAAMTKLFVALTGGDGSLLAEAVSDWERLSKARRVDDMSIAAASRVISNAAGNVRPGHARLNTDIGNAFDPELDHAGRYTARTWKIIDAVQGLALAEGISHTDSMDALSPPTPRSCAMSGYSSTGSGSSHLFARPESRESAARHRPERRASRSQPREFPPSEATLLPPRGGKKRKRKD